MGTVGIRERIRNRRPHREQIPIRGREIAGILALVCLVALPVAFGLLQASEYVRTNFEIEQLRRQKLAQQENYRRLRIEKATLESLDRIEAEARKRGLVPPEPLSTVLSSPPSSGRLVPASERAAASPAETTPTLVPTSVLVSATLPSPPLALPEAVRSSSSLPAHPPAPERPGDRVPARDSDDFVGAQPGGGARGR